ncbi:MAG: lyase family protein [Acidobacteriota bacterium]
MDRFDCVSPLDYRYYGGNESFFRKVHPFLSERANIKYCLKVEAALARGLARRRVFSMDVADEIETACANVTAEAVYEHDQRIHHYTRALVEALRDQLSERARPYVHLFATSFDIVDTALALRLRDFVREVVVPDLRALAEVLIRLALSTSDIVQVGRTHGQHAVPITFGFAVAGYVDRLGGRIERISKEADDLRGKMSGAVGAYNSFSLQIPDPEYLEAEILADLGLKPNRHSTQIVQPEHFTDLMCSVATCFGLLANIADDMRHLQRTEIAEVYEYFSGAQVGSSTMPHKRNPWNFEHVKSMWKEFTPRILTVLADVISEHQRDLTNSATRRFLPEIMIGFAEATERLTRQCGSLRVDTDSMRRHLDASSQASMAEPIYILLALAGLPDAHEYVRKLTLKGDITRSLIDAVLADPDVAQYLGEGTVEQLEALRVPERYTGVAIRKTHEICTFWETALGLDVSVPLSQS